MSREIYFFRPSKTLNSTGSTVTVFDEAIAAIQNNIDAISDKINGVGGFTPITTVSGFLNNPIADPRMGLLSAITYYQNRADALLSHRDKLRANDRQRSSLNTEIGNSTTNRDTTHREFLNLTDQLNDLKDNKLPAAVAIKKQHELETYNQTFAGQGRDVKGEQEKIRLEGEAARLLAESNASLKKMQTEAAIKIESSTNKTTRYIIIIVVVAFILTTTIIIIKRRKKA